MVQLAAGARVDVQVFAKMKEDAPGPVKAMPPMVRGEPPVLVRVTVCDWLAPPMASGPKERLVADIVTAAGVMPVPFSVTDCGEFGALSVMDKVAVAKPAAAGSKLKFTWHDALAGTLVPQLLEAINEEAL